MMKEKINLLIVAMIFSIFLFLAFQLGKSEKPDFTYDTAFELINSPQENSHRESEPPKGDQIKRSYVPAYSHIYSSQKNAIEMAITLSLRNTDKNQKIVIQTVFYYNTEGKLIRQYLKDGYTLNPLETKEVFIESNDLDGGSGANFLIEYTANNSVSNPIFETIMVSNKSGENNLTFISRGEFIQ